MPKNLIVIPAFNEEASLAKTVESLKDLPADYEVVIINDGSLDRTGPIAERLTGASHRKVYSLHLPYNLGIGAAMQTGFRFAEQQGDYEYLIQFDSDGQHHPAWVEPLVKACREKGLDLCVGSRFLDPALDPGFRSTVLRRVGIRFFAILISLLSGVHVTDPTSGFRCMGPKAWKRFARHYPTDYPEPESLFWCARSRFKVSEIPVRMCPRVSGSSSIRALRSVYYMVKVSVAILVDRLRGRED
jgi:glycosyltransferase involved in cell wall biosynthesis